MLLYITVISWSDKVLNPWTFWWQQIKTLAQNLPKISPGVTSGVLFVTKAARLKYSITEIGINQLPLFNSWTIYDLWSFTELTYFSCFQVKWSKSQISQLVQAGVLFLRSARAKLSKVSAFKDTSCLVECRDFPTIEMIHFSLYCTCWNLTSLSLFLAPPSCLSFSCIFLFSLPADTQIVYRQTNNQCNTAY